MENVDMKNRIIACITAALLVLTGASVWEGAASIAPLGDLPDEGFYAATNSFPRNTVVDITNLETGQSIRVIVAAGLETPGLLAVLSRDAAGMIGIRARSIGRIRMTQPSDPVAFSRFTEGLASSGDPDYDPGALVSADPLARSYVQTPAAPAESVPAPVYDPGEGAGASNPWYDEIVDLPDPYRPAFSPGTDEGIVRETSPAPVYPEDPWEAVPAETAETSEAPFGDVEPGVRIAEEPDGPAAEIPETWPVAVPEIPEEPAAEIARTEVPETPEAPAWEEEEFEFDLVPAEEQPPKNGSGYVIPPELVLEPIPERSPGEQAAGPEPVMDESQFVGPPGTVPVETATIPEASPAQSPPSLPGIFSVPLIGVLEPGKYYLQIGAFSRTELVESLAAKVGNGYPLAVQNGGSEERPLYRLLIGPVNLGESGALLQRFKSIGYNDVFVRKGS
jgi:cell division septation protein DedD